jgi:hypothetical protein
MSVAVEFKNVDIIFGKSTGQAIAMLDAGSNRSDILAKTGSVLGAAGANLVVNEGEISVLMGLSGSGKSTLLRAVNGLNKVTRGEVIVHDGDWSADVASCGEEELRKSAANAPPVSSNCCCRGDGRTERWASASNSRRSRARAQRTRGVAVASRGPRPVGRQIRPRASGRHAAACRTCPRLLPPKRRSC